MTTQTPGTAEAIRSLDTDDVLTDVVLGQLAEAIGQTTLEELGAMQPWQIKQLISPNMVGVDGLGKIATALLTALRTEGYLAAPATPADTTSVAGSLNVNVVTPPKPNEMTIRQLLGALNADPSRYTDLVAFINATGAVQFAMRKTPNWVVMHTEGKVDIDATLAYLEQLLPTFAKARRTLQDGRRPVTLARAFGQQERPMMHPFMRLQPVTGLDELGFDFGTLDDTLHKALIWAFKTGHELWPTNLDRFEASTEVFQSTLPARWQRILDDYQAAVAEDEGNAISTRYYTDVPAAQLLAEAGGAAPFGGRTAEPVRDDTWYEGRLREIALSAVNGGMNGYRRNHAVITSVNGGMGNVHITAIVLEGVNGGMGTVTGSIYLPPGRSVDPGMGGCEAEVRNLPWRKLYELAVEWGLIEDPNASQPAAKYKILLGNNTGTVVMGDGNTVVQHWT